MNKTPNQSLIALIVDDIASHAPFNPYADQIPADLSGAYDIQDDVVAMLQSRGIRGAPCGYKLTVNSRQLMALFSIDEPAVGRMFSDQNLISPARLKAGDIVICGTHLVPMPLNGASHVVADMDALGTVEFSIA